MTAYRLPAPNALCSFCGSPYYAQPSLQRSHCTRACQSQDMATRVEERFWSKVNFDGPVPECAPGLGPCWLWKAHLGPGGYGDFGVLSPRRVERAHRVAFALWHGRWPSVSVDHLCRVRACVNPLHLEAVSVRENNLRGTGYSGRNARKLSCPMGHPYDLVRVDGKGRESRHCRQCVNAQHRARHAARKAGL